MGQFHSQVYSVGHGGSDSGTVDCLLRDSSFVNDTTVRWTLIESRHLLARRWSTFPTTDTTYLIDDSTVTSLHESTTGNHILQSQALVWNSPSWSPFSDTIPIYRFAQSTPQLFANSGGYCQVVPANFDSIWQSSDSGLFQRSYSRCFDYDEIRDYELHAFRLLSFTLVGVDEQSFLPSEVRLLQNFPNPFNSTTTIVFDVAGRVPVRVTVHDLLGRQIAVITESIRQAGRHMLTFDAAGLASGIYIVRLQAMGSNATRKILLLR
jgi:hypothetical protein